MRGGVRWCLLYYYHSFTLVSGAGTAVDDISGVYYLN